MTLITKGKTLNNGNKTKTNVSITCYKCGEEGHLATNCPSTPKQEKMNDPLNHEEHSASGNQLLMQGIPNSLDAYSFNSQGIIEGNGIANSAAVTRHNISQQWILLDNQSIVDVSSTQE
jgi:6-phosphogluconolactonase/glucosamine-6-phosphate isomerase/deaminase